LLPRATWHVRPQVQKLVVKHSQCVCTFEIFLENAMKRRQVETATQD